MAKGRVRGGKKGVTQVPNRRMNGVTPRAIGLFAGKK